MQASSTHPLLVLQDIDNACRKNLSASAVSAPPPTNTLAQTANDNTWSGVGFRLADDELLIKNTYIDEIIDTRFRQNLSTMPGAKSWLLGLISLRGQPLSVIDLKQYLFNQKSTITAGSRLIVIKHDNYIAGLLVGHIYGLKQFDANSAQTAEQLAKLSTKLPTKKGTALFSKNVSPFIDEIFIDQQVHQGHLSIPKLINSQDFADAAR